ncbi:MAG TPA: potassium channel family protein [Candidatus Paceibacterota bacterium]|nr:potassium channel family protein [Candidatus Paceibacterota bacterium]
MPKRVLIVGSGHLAFRVKKLAENAGHTVIHIPGTDLDPQDGRKSISDTVLEILQKAKVETLSVAYVIDERDDLNLEVLVTIISLNKNLPIVASLFNENVAPHFKAAYPNIEIINPAKIAAPKFVDSLYHPVERLLDYKVERGNTVRDSHADSLVRILLATSAALVGLAMIFFHFADKLSWLDSLYFVVSTISTVGYGDINLLNSSAASKIADIILILTSMVLVWLTFSLTIDGMLKKRANLSLGRKRYSLRDHVVLCGLGRVGFFIAEELIRRGEKFIIIEMDESSSKAEYFRSRDIDVYTGDARLPQVLEDAGIKRAKAVISVINNDYVNLEIGLNARSFKPKQRLILRIFDEAMAQKIRESLDIHLALSTSAIAAERFLASLK